MRVKLQLFLSHNGVCSRRDAMALIQEGHVTVNDDLVTEPSFQVDAATDRVAVDGVIVGQKEYAYVLLNKPAGYVTTMEDEHAEKTVMDLLPQKYQHLKPVGRLDKDTEGLLLLTNDGLLANQLTHPKFNVDKVYRARVDGVLGPDAVKQLERGVRLEEGFVTSPAKVKLLGTRDHLSEFEITIHEGKKRQIRQMCEAVGYEVVYLQRLQQGPLTLGDLPVGQWRLLEPKEVETLKSRNTLLTS